MEKNKGTAGTGDANIGKSTGGNMTEPPVDAAPKLADIGITKRQSSEYQQLANIPEGEVDARIEEQKAEGKPPTISATLKPHVSHHPAWETGRVFVTA